jgi:hypothetical protein
MKMTLAPSVFSLRARISERHSQTRPEPARHFTAQAPH